MVGWREIIEKIQECKRQRNPEVSLRALFEETNDGMVAFSLGEELEKASRFAEALHFFEEAERLFPIEKYKERARAAAERVRRRIPAATPQTPTQPIMQQPTVESEDTLFVVSCTKTKIWEKDPAAPRYVPAEHAYVGHTMLEWLQSDFHRRAKCWVILSAKYGFIEPDHPIGNYDVSFDNDRSGPVSLDSLRAQVECQSRGQDGWRLNGFSRVAVWGSDLYSAVVRAAFMRTPARIEKIG
jgi:hypothetical protein